MNPGRRGDAAGIFRAAAQGRHGEHPETRKRQAPTAESRQPLFQSSGAASVAGGTHGKPGQAPALQQRMRLALSPDFYLY